MFSGSPFSSAPLSSLGTVALSLSAAVGTFTVAGQDATPAVARSMVADAGTFALAGQDATLTRGVVVQADHGVFTLSGQSTAFGRGYAVGGDFATYTLAGQDAGVGIARDFSVDHGTYALTGQDAAFPVQRTVAADNASYSLTGQDANVIAGRQVVADVGSFALAGQAATPAVSRRIDAAHGVYTLAGQDATLLKGKRLTADYGVYTLTGQDATLVKTDNQLTAHQLDPFPSPVNTAAPVDANIIRSNDNLITQAFNAHDADETIHVRSGRSIWRPTTASEGSVWVATDTQDTFIYTSSAWTQIAWAHWYGDFYDTTDQAIATINTEQLVTINSTGTTRGMTLVSGSQVRATYAGDYNVMFSAQVKNTDSAEHNVSFWWKKNGTNIADSAGQVTLPKKHGSGDGHLIAMWNVFVPMAANDYLQLYWQGPSTMLSLETIPAAGSVPRIPSVIVTINRI